MFMEEKLWIIIAVVVLVVFWLSKKGDNSLNAPMSKLVLTKFKFGESEGSNELAYLSGRKSGIIGWLLVKIGLGAETVIHVTKDELSFKSSSLSGEFHSLMTLKNISSSHCGYYKPVIYLILAILFLVLALVVMFTGEAGLGVFFIVLAIIFGVLYYFNKMIRIMVHTKGGATFGMCFSPSLIEGVDVNIDKAKAVVELINKYMLVEQKK